MQTPLLLIAPLTLPVGARVARQLTGSLQGVVVDSSGKAVSNAIVHALPEQNMLRQIRTTADEQGRFVFKALPPGMVDVDAFKETDGFPYNFFAFFNQNGRAVTKVEVKASGTTPDVVINLGSKAAHLSINLIDEAGIPIKKPMALSFTRDDMPGDYKSSVAAPYSMLVPCVPFSFSVDVEGYRLWHSEVIALRPDETLDVEVKLQTK
jgi:Carboxypeptidase regulatory-like domain